MNKKIPVEVYSRVVGYFRPVSQWNRGQQEQFKDRLLFDNKKIEENIKNFKNFGNNPYNNI